MTAALRTGQLADAVGVNVETLRYYERRGLLAEPDRTLGGHRLYPPESVTTLRVIRATQRLGFTLDEVAELLALGRHGHEMQRPRLHERTVQKLADVQARIADLEVVRDTLRAAVDAGCDDLRTCAANDRCPLPLGEPAPPRATPA